jgi:hypothetical protein
VLQGEIPSAVNPPAGAVSIRAAPWRSRSARPNRRCCCPSKARDAYAATFRSRSLRAATESTHHLPCPRSISCT